MENPAINRQSRTSVHFSINYVIAAPWPVDRTKSVEFQKALLDNGLDFARTSIAVNNFLLVRQEPSNLQVKLDSPAPQLSGIQIIAQNPSCDLEMFIQEVGAVTAAYQQTFPAEQYQLIRCAAKIQHLYSCQIHAFQYLWEDRLNQSPADFTCLGQRPVAGGGLRLVMPPYAEPNQQPRSAEIRIESFLREQKKILIETTFVWPKPMIMENGASFDHSGRLNTLNEYAANQVWQFLIQQRNENE